MRAKGVVDSKYFVGIQSLSEVATREDRVCELNIMGGESSDVTPVGHAYSGANVVFGTSPGRKGQAPDTPAGPIPVYNNVREGLEAGHRFDCRVVLPRYCSRCSGSPARADSTRKARWRRPPSRSSSTRACLAAPPRSTTT